MIDVTRGQWSFGIGPLWLEAMWRRSCWSIGFDVRVGWFRCYQLSVTLTLGPVQLAGAIEWGAGK